ncbi:Rrf2 family transcriptional regulator [Thalassotalea marina]|uniref:Transcriptional regulator n=1 Tax=Thalassotalea marina TaxID=1673741 RepID=A0A919BAK3_9GAMM|nr:Rrf2 family transcriptional regulator [Thalassotalea marina]GHF79046.1 transcriptional regulator [Thalassotalea marina]
MQLTRYTDYGLRVLVYLALLPKGERASITVISETYDISRNIINKIVHQLGKEGLISTYRGKGGGFELKKHPKEINIGEVVLLLENSMTVIDCNSPQCVILSSCKLQHILHEATNAFVGVLKSYTLNDLIGLERENLIELLEISC